MRKWICMILEFSLAGLISAAEKTSNLSGTWILDRTQSDSGQPRQGRRAGGFPGGILGFPGGGYPGGGYPGGGYPGGGYPGGGYPGTGYPGSRGAGGYPGDGSDGEGMPRGQMQNLTLQIVQTENEVQTTRNFTVNGKEQTITQKFALDGSQNTNPSSNGRGEFVSTSTWKNNKLTNLGTQTVALQEQSNDTTLREEYSLSKDGKVLTIKTTRTTQRGSTNSKQVFNRQEPSSSESSPSEQ